MKHYPVMLPEVLEALQAKAGELYVDGTFGYGGYSEAILQAEDCYVIGLDRDPNVAPRASELAEAYSGRFRLIQTPFSALDTLGLDPVDAVILDIGVSSMQLDEGQRGFSFMRDGPLDMRMSQDGPPAADIVNEAEEEVIANILFQYGEERASRRIAKAIVRAREEAPITTTLALAGLVESCLPRSKPGQSHPATRSFQALRIAVNNEYGELFNGLMAAERALKPGGQLAVVTFHSVEDRMVKRFLTARAGAGGNANRFAPEIEAPAPQFKILKRKAIGPDAQELEENPRSRSAKLRVAIRTDAPAGSIDAKTLGMPMVRGLTV
mgnify:CR=1 FL=1